MYVLPPSGPGLTSILYVKSPVPTTGPEIGAPTAKFEFALTVLE